MAAAILPVRDAIGGDLPYSPAKEKGSKGGVGTSILIRRLRHYLIKGGYRVKRPLVIFSCLLLGVLLVLAFRIGVVPSSSPSPAYSFTASASSRAGYTVLINTWKRNNLLKQAVAHYASCSRVDAIHVVWSESDPPSYSLKSHLWKLIHSKSQNAHKPNFKFDINEEDNLNNRFKPIKDLISDAIFSVDDDIIVPCHTLDFAFGVWQSAQDAMVGFVPRMHWISEEKDGKTYYDYAGWWSTWWTGTYSMILTKAAFFHRKYLDLYTYKMPSSIHDYVTRERNCEDIAMSLLVSNATAAAPIWVKGKIYEIGSSGISSLQGHNDRRTKCLNDFVSLYGSMPLVSTNLKAVDSRGEWFW